MQGYGQLTKGRVSAPGQIYHVISRSWQRQKLFHQWELASAACRAFSSERAMRDSVLLCWALMPDHAHWLVELGAQDDLPSLIGRMKSLAARQISQSTAHRGKVWHKGFYDRAIRKEDDLLTVARYIVANPLRAGLCSSVREYPYWNAIYL